MFPQLSVYTRLVGDWDLIGQQLKFGDGRVEYALCYRDGGAEGVLECRPVARGVRLRCPPGFYESLGDVVRLAERPRQH